MKPIADKKRRRGRPKELVPTFGYAQIVLTLDEMIEAYRAKGMTERQSRQAAFLEAAEALTKEDTKGRPLRNDQRRAIDLETLERYYRMGTRELRPAEMRLAQEIDRTNGECDDWGLGGVVSRRYRRGKRALRAAAKKEAL